MNRVLPVCSPFIAALSCLLCFAGLASSEENAGPGSAKYGAGLSFSAAYLHQIDADLDSGGDFGVDRYFLRLDGTKRQSSTLSLGIGVSYDFSDFSFSNAALAPGGAPWDQVHNLNLSASSISSLATNWKLFIAPSVGIAAASGADVEDALVYGGIIWGSYRFTPELALGLGAGIFSKPEELSAFPVIVVDWSISERLRLSNPRNQGPAGPAGLELSYVFDGGSSVAAGGAYRSHRFRLADSGTVPGGVGEDRAFPVWVKLSTGIGARGTLSIFGGAMTGGKLTVEDRRGNRIAEHEYEASPFVSSNFSLSF